jgi:UDPglucose 6-dehydrogenase
VATPADEHGGFSTEYIQAAAARIGEALQRKSDWHLVILTSTVLPGSTDRDLVTKLEEYSGKRCGMDFGLCYNPEFIALGSVVRDMLNPDFVLIGESDDRSGSLLEQFYKGLAGEDVPIARMSIVNAELAKISVNTFVTTKISYANMLAEICERLPGCDVDVVTSAIGLDKRIGTKYIKGALGYGGPCFPRDNTAFSYMARSVGAEPTLAEATDEINWRQVPRLAELVSSYLQEGGTVGILGLSYKPNTNVIEESQGLELARTLLENNTPVILYDPLAMDDAKEVLGDGSIFAQSFQECVNQADVIVIATPWPEFREIQSADLGGNSKCPVVLDCWRMLDRDQFKRPVNYVTLGSGERT